MLDRAVHAPVGEQAHEVQRAGARCDVRDGASQCLVLAELARTDRGVDDRDALRDDAAAAEVHVADLAVAHDAGGEADRFARGLQRRVRPALEQRAPVRQLGGRDGVASRGIAAAPAVEHRENDRSVSHAALAIRVAKPTASSDAPPTRPPLTLGCRT